MNRPIQFRPLYVVVSRDEVESRDLTAPLAALKSLIASPATARAHMESVDVAFSGYDEDARELFEIPEVREYVYRLDGEFPAGGSGRWYTLWSARTPTA
jgi:hypothetical protein